MKTLKQILFLFLGLLCISATYPNWPGIKGNGKITTIERTTPEYNEIKCAGFMDFVLTKGKEGNITIKGDENLLEYIITEVKNNKLIIRTKNGTTLRPSKNNNIVISIPFQDIEAVSLSGSGDLSTTNAIVAKNFKIKLTGSGDVVLDLDSDKIETEISGSGDMTLTGLTNALNLKLSGSGEFHGYDLASNITETLVTGSGEAEITSNEFLKARVTGSGDISYKGNAKIDSKVSGSGRISQR